MYGLATDDSHNYHSTSPKASLSGRGWVMVRAKSLDAASIVAAMEKGISMPRPVSNSPL
jgi:hypothetical protein